MLAHRRQHLEGPLKATRDHGALTGHHIGEPTLVIMQADMPLQHKEILMFADGKHNAPTPHLAGPDARAQALRCAFVQGPGFATRATRLQPIRPRVIDCGRRRRWIKTNNARGADMRAAVLRHRVTSQLQCRKL